MEAAGWGGVWISSGGGREALSAEFWGRARRGRLRSPVTRSRGWGRWEQPEPKVSPPQLRQPQPRGAGLAAGRPRCGHIWGAAAGPGPEQPERVTWHRAGPLRSLKAKTPGRGGGEHPGRERSSTPRVHAPAHQPCGPAQPLPQEPGAQVQRHSQLCDLKQVTQLLWASVASTVKGT